MLNRAGLWSALLVTGLNFAPVMGMSSLVPGSEQGGGINKSLDWLLLEPKEACVSKMQRHREMFFTRDFAWQVGRGAFKGRCVFVL